MVKIYGWKNSNKAGKRKNMTKKEEDHILKIEELENANTLLTEELEGAKDALEFKKK